MNVEELKADYTWMEVFAYASGVATCSGCGSATPGAVGETPPSTEPFGIDDVEEVLHMVEGENEGPNWVIVVRLKDGRFGSINAGCDCTGWDCQAGGSSSVASSYEQIIRFGIGDTDRTRLGITSLG